MTTKVLLSPLAAITMLVLAGCGDAPDNPVSVETQPDGSSTMQIQLPEELTPAAEALADPEAALQNLQRDAATMTDEAKVQAVEAARATAEEGARLLGRTDAEITAAGDEAERNARQALGLQ
jgi:hypothetical protein